MHNPVVWFSMVMAIFLYATGAGAFHDGQAVVGICAMVAGVAMQFAVIDMAGRK